MLAPYQFHYRIERRRDGTYQAVFFQLPECHCAARSLDALFASLEDAIVSALETRLAQKEPLPEFERAHAGENTHTLNTTHMLKLQMHVALAAREWSLMEFGQRLGLRPQEVTRLLRLSHPTKIDPIMEALQVLGVQIQWNVSLTEFPPESYR